LKDGRSLQISLNSIM